MTELEEYIRSHAEAFDTESPAGGHEARFLARLDAINPVPAAGDAGLQSVLTAKSPARAKREAAAGRKARFLRRSAVWAFALACTLLALLLIRPGDPFRGVSDNPVDIYLAYMDHVGDLYRKLPPGDSAEWDDTLRELTEEELPLFEQLPEELPGRDKARILKAYYSELLGEARQLKKTIK